MDFLKLESNFMRISAQQVLNKTTCLKALKPFLFVLYYLTHFYTDHVFVTIFRFLPGFQRN